MICNQKVLLYFTICLSVCLSVFQHVRQAEAEPICLSLFLHLLLSICPFDYLYYIFLKQSQTGNTNTRSKNFLLFIFTPYLFKSARRIRSMVQFSKVLIKLALNAFQQNISFKIPQLKKIFKICGTAVIFPTLLFSYTNNPDL